MSILLLTTGGTIDGLEYSSENNNPKEIKILIPKFLKQGRSYAEIKIEPLMSKDSKFINEDDRKIIFEKCMNAKEEKIIITHGTVTLCETAEYLDKQKIPKTIVLTGSMVPADKPESDALFNLGSAIIAVQSLPKGVHVIMNGKIFKAGKVKKNKKTGIFEETF